MLFRLASPRVPATLHGARGEDLFRPSTHSAPMTREEKLMPNGIPKYLRIYDGDTADRYTVIFTGRYRGREGYSYVGMSEAPTHPLGFYQHSWHPDAIDLDRWGYAPKVGQKCHLGKRIEFQELPEECRKLIAQEYRELWSIKP